MGMRGMSRGTGLAAALFAAAIGAGCGPAGGGAEGDTAVAEGAPVQVGEAVQVTVYRAPT